MSEGEVGAAAGWGPRTADRPALRRFAIGTALALLYFAGGRLGLALAEAHPSATALWPAVGIAIAGLLVLGPRFWPAVLVGSFGVNFTTLVGVADSWPVAAMTSFAIAAGNAIEALLVVLLLRRFGDGVRSFERASGVFLFVFAVGFAALVSATTGVSSLWVAGLAQSDRLPTIWTNWWTGNVVGAMLLAPTLVLWSRPVTLDPRTSKWAEAGILLGLILAVAFDPGGFLAGSQVARPPPGFVVLPLIVWTAFRFTPREAATATLILSLGFTTNTLAGRGPYARDDAAESLILLALAVGVLAFVSMVLAALVADRRREAAFLREARDQLEARVVERTESLSVAVERLRDEIVERERVEGDLRRSRARLVEAQHLARMGNWDWDPDRDVFVGSDELYSVFGLAPSEFPTNLETFLDHVHPEDRAGVQRSMAAARLTGEPFELDHRIVRPDGGLRWLHLQGRAETESEGSPARLAGTAQDITDRVRLERERAEAEERAKEVLRLQELNELKTRFMNTAAHELNTPLTPIRVQLHLLRQRLRVEDNSDAFVSFKVLERNIERMIGLVGDVLEAARLQAERLGIQKERVDLVRLAQEAVESFQGAAREAGLQLEASLGDRLVVDADPKRISQVLYNLLSNSLKFTPRGGRVRVSSRTHNGGAEIRVEDSGIGLTPQQIERLFQPFSQVHEGAVTSRPGTGLGLYISKGIAELHGGSLRAESAGAGRGTAFTLALPTPELGASPRTPMPTPSTT